MVGHSRSRICANFGRATKHPELKGVLVCYHTRDIFVDITERCCSIPGPVKRRTHDDGFRVAIRDTIRSWGTT